MLCSTLGRVCVWSDLRTNRLSEEIGGAIRKNATLKTLNLSHNRIQTMGAFVIADGIDENKTIIRLTMDGNPIGMEGGACVRVALVSRRARMPRPAGERPRVPAAERSPRAVIC